MNTARAKPAAEINLEEFERRLRAAAAPQAGVEDPLAELTRLVDTINLDRTPAERALEATRTPKLALQAPQPAPPAPAPAAPSAKAPPPPPQNKPAPSPAIKVPPASGSPGAKVTPLNLGAAAKAATPASATPAPVAEAEPPATPPQGESPVLEEGAPPLRMSLDSEEPPAFAPPPPPSRPQRMETVIVNPGPQTTRSPYWNLKVGGLTALAVVMIAGALALKFTGHARLGAPPTILASQSPTKVAPPSDETVRTANESGSLLNHDSAQTTPTQPKLVTPTEAPVDLAARPAPTAASDADASPVAPSSSTPILASQPPGAAPAAPVGVDPSRVKTISVRPDGTLISSGYEANAATAAPAPPAAPPPRPAVPATVDAEATTPTPALPTKLSPPKNSARVTPKTDTTAQADGGTGAVPVKPKKPKPTPTPAAAAAEPEPKTDGAADAGGDGGFAVQFAAPRSQADADSLVKKLPARYGDALGSTPLNVVVADRDGGKIYRVRTGNLSKADARALCVKIKSAGGDCFVARN